ncbi:MAG: precorrin-3B C(17)-methyltransferase [Acidimicrobiales bacterium]
MKVIAVSVTAAGQELAARLAYERHHGRLAETLRERWDTTDAFVLFAAVGAVVRIVAPLLKGKERDPALVCVDDMGRHVVAVLGGHAASANALAKEVAASIGAEPVLTTATDAVSMAALDQLPGFSAHGDVAAVTAAMLNGERPMLERCLDWPVPGALLSVTSEASKAAAVPARRIVVTDRLLADEPGTVVLCPLSLVAGVGTSTHAPPEEVEALLAAALSDGGLERASVARIATIDRRRDHPAIRSLNLPVDSFTPEVLAAVDVPSPSPVVHSAVGTPSVAEAAALVAAGSGAQLVVAKRVSAHATVAIARRASAPGRLTLVGLGPGGPQLRAPAATAALRSADTIVGFSAYLDQCRDATSPSQDLLASPIGDEIARARLALERARQGCSVAVVCSGDSGVYAMASLVIEEAGEEPGVDISVIPGITAGLAAASLLGAPLGHDHLVLSLSDLLTPWDTIRSRVEAARDADLVLVLYNPRSRQRDWQLAAVRDLLLQRRAGSTPVGIVTDAGRKGERSTVTTLGDLDPEGVGMTTCVIVGASTTRVVNGRIVTPRGYHRPERP